MIFSLAQPVVCDCLIVELLLLGLFDYWDILVYHIQSLANVTMVTTACNLLGSDVAMASRAVVYCRAKRPKCIAGCLVPLN
jgi:hypothetical protein